MKTELYFSYRLELSPFRAFNWTTPKQYGHELCLQSPEYDKTRQCYGRNTPTWVYYNWRDTRRLLDFLREIFDKKLKIRILEKGWRIFDWNAKRKRPLHLTSREFNSGLDKNGEKIHYAEVQYSRRDAKRLLKFLEYVFSDMTMQMSQGKLRSKISLSPL